MAVAVVLLFLLFGPGLLFGNFNHSTSSSSTSGGSTATSAGVSSARNCFQSGDCSNLAVYPWLYRTETYTGIADYGVKGNSTYAAPYTIDNIRTVNGSEKVTAVTVNQSYPTYYNHTYGYEYQGLSSTQLNSVVRVVTSDGARYYWAQNTVSFQPGDKNTTAFGIPVGSVQIVPDENVWNWTAGANGRQLSGGGEFEGVNGVYSQYQYEGVGRQTLTFPVSMSMLTKTVLDNSSTVSIYFYLQISGSPPLQYNNVTIRQASVLEISQIVSGSQLTSGNFSEAHVESVGLGFGGLELGVSADYIHMNATAALSYTLTNGTTLAPPALWQYVDTGEGAANLQTTLVNGVFWVMVGPNNNGLTNDTESWNSPY